MDDCIVLVFVTVDVLVFELDELPLNELDEVDDFDNNAELELPGDIEDDTVGDLVFITDSVGGGSFDFVIVVVTVNVFINPVRDKETVAELVLVDIPDTVIVIVERTEFVFIIVEVPDSEIINDFVNLTEYDIIGEDDWVFETLVETVPHDELVAVFVPNDDKVEDFVFIPVKVNVTDEDDVLVDNPDLVVDVDPVDVFDERTELVSVPDPLIVRVFFDVILNVGVVDDVFDGAGDLDTVAEDDDDFELGAVFEFVGDEDGVLETDELGDIDLVDVVVFVVVDDAVYVFVDNPLIVCIDDAEDVLLWIADPVGKIVFIGLLVGYDVRVINLLEIPVLVDVVVLVDVLDAVDVDDGIALFKSNNRAESLFIKLNDNKKNNIFNILLLI